MAIGVLKSLGIKLNDLVSSVGSYFTPSTSGGDGQTIDRHSPAYHEIAHFQKLTATRGAPNSLLTRSSSQLHPEAAFKYSRVEECYDTEDPRQEAVFAFRCAQAYESVVSLG